MPAVHDVIRHPEVSDYDTGRAEFRAVTERDDGGETISRTISIARFTTAGSGDLGPGEFSIDLAEGLYETRLRITGATTSADWARLVVPAGGGRYLTLLQAYDGAPVDDSALESLLAVLDTTYVAVDDVRLSDARTPTDGSVTTAKVADGAITGVKIANGASFNVRDYGAVGDGAADDRAAIQAAIAASTDGSTVLFPPGIYRVGGTVYLRGLRTYRGTAAGTTGKSVIILGAAVNLSGPVLAAEVYGTAKTTCDDPLLIVDLTIDGNKSAQASGTVHGVLLINFWSTLQRCYIRNCSGAGIKLTDVKASGTVTNSCSENKVLHCKIDKCVTGIAQESANGVSNQDGFADDNLISDATDGIILGRAAGWSVRRNHLYGILQNGIHLTSGYATVVADNYVEDFGSVGAGWWAGINITQLNDRGSTVSGNHVSAPSVAAANRLACYSVRGGNGQTRAVVTMAANSAFGTGDSNCFGLFTELDSGGALAVGRAAHVYMSINIARRESIAAAVTVSVDDQTILGWAQAGSYQLITATRNTEGGLTGGTVLWPDAATGTMTTTLSTDSASLNAVNAYVVTHILGGVTTTYTQPTMTRDSTTGAVTAQPALVVS